MKLVVNFSDFADLISDPAVVISGEEVVYLNDMAKIAFSSLKVGENICKFLSLPIMYIETIGDAPYTFNYKGITYNVFTAVFNNETFLLFRKNSTLPVSPLLFYFQSSINLTTRIRDYLSQSFISFAALSKLMTEDDRERLGGTLSVMRRELFRELKLI
ncbi:MAG: hypothetical protein GX633_08035, partial [Clostridiales bacterium]|nr:hypothetical protein [Clostridiales bacterium]